MNPMSAVTKLAHDPDMIERLELEAARSPRAYKLRLTALAVAGDLALTTTQVLPLAAPIVIGALIVNLTSFYWLSAAVVIFLAWMFRPQFRFDGRRLTEEEAPALYGEMQRLRRTLGVPSRMLVQIDGSFNASAAEARGLFGIFGTRCVLTLGLPLLMALTREQALAVIAHEFGHFSRRHGRLGHWLYRARAGWIQYAQHVRDSDSSFDRAAAWYAGKFVPFFAARSFVHSRQCEYEADADAAAAVGARSCAEALARLAVTARIWEERFPRELAHWQLEHAEPPHDFYERFVRAVRARPPGELQPWLDDALLAPSSWHDTHPSLSERLRSLAQSAALAAPAESAAEVLFGERLATLLAEFNEKWVREIRAEWLVQHLRLRHIDHPLLSADEATESGWSADLRLDRAQALRRSDPARGLAELQRLHQSNPGHRRIEFAYAAALVDENDEAGIALLEALAREDPAFRAAAFSRVVAYFDSKGDSQQVERWSTWLMRVSQSVADAISRFWALAEAGGTRPSSLPQPKQAVLSQAAELDACVAKAWLREGDASLLYAADRPAIPLLIHLVILAIDPAEAKRAEQDEESVRARYESLLRSLIPPDEVAVVRTYFTTEDIPAGPIG